MHLFNQGDFLRATSGTIKHDFPVLYSMGATQRGRSRCAQNRAAALREKVPHSALQGTTWHVRASELRFPFPSGLKKARDVCISYMYVCMYVWC